jgi:hypothetical protein
MNAFQARGQHGVIRVGYMQAAELGAWHLVKGDGQQWQLDAAITRSDAYWLAQQPKDLLLDVGTQGSWRWRVDAVTVDGPATRLVATMHGRPDRR